MQASFYFGFWKKEKRARFPLMRRSRGVWEQNTKDIVNGTCHPQAGVKVALRPRACSSPAPATKLALGPDFSLSHWIRGRPLSSWQCVWPGPKLELGVIEYSRFVCYEVFLCLGYCHKYLVCVITLNSKTYPVTWSYYYTCFITEDVLSSLIGGQFLN